jgi:hypothetical protein
LLPGALFPKTEEGTMVGMIIVPAAVAAVFFKKFLRFIGIFLRLCFLTEDR